MPIYELILSIVYVILALFLIVVVILQSGKSSGLSGAIGGGSGDTFLAKNKSKSMDARLAKMTKWVAIVFMVLTLVMCFIVRRAAKNQTNAARIKIRAAFLFAGKGTAFSGKRITARSSALTAQNAVRTFAGRTVCSTTYAPRSNTDLILFAPAGANALHKFNST